MDRIGKVLLADDHHEVRSLVRMILEPEEWQIVGEAANGLQAVELCVALHPDIVVLDVSMPVMNGIEATRQIAKTCSNTQVVLLSVHADRHIVKQGFAAGARAYVVKDHAASALLTAMREVREGRTYICPKILQPMRDDARHCA